VPERPNFPKEEEKVLQYWKEIQAFEKQLELSKGKPAFTFYDGPPFATGLPHYGHIAAGTIKVSAIPGFVRPNTTNLFLCQY
jgi:isoleucyl-tRNA synthetase